MADPLRTCPVHPEHALLRQADGRWLCATGHTVPTELPKVRDDRDPIGDYCRDDHGGSSDELLGVVVGVVYLAVLAVGLGAGYLIGRLS